VLFKAVKRNENATKTQRQHNENAMKTQKNAMKTQRKRRRLSGAAFQFRFIQGRDLEKRSFQSL
jgi:hypothetical protein